MFWIYLININLSRCIIENVELGLTFVFDMDVFWIFGGRVIGVWIQDFILARQVLYHLGHVSALLSAFLLEYLDNLYVI
jgi:hypothetical protein